MGSSGFTFELAGVARGAVLLFDAEFEFEFELDEELELLPCEFDIFAFFGGT